MSPLGLSLFWLTAVVFSCLSPVSPVPVPQLPQTLGKRSTVHHPVRRDATPILARDFPDPSIFHDISSHSWTAFATHSAMYNVQVAKSLGDAFRGHWTWLDMDALPNPGQWVVQSADPNVVKVWAPDVLQLPNGTFALYYSAIASASSKHCIGVAYSPVLVGPYQPSSEPLASHSDLGGAIDPAGFFDSSSGRTYVVYKIDGNSIGLRQPDGRPSTPIMLQEVDSADGATRLGEPQSILDISLDAEGSLIEGPAIVRSSQGMYFLTYSGAAWDSPQYYTRYAYAWSIAGPYTKTEQPLLSSGIDGTTLSGPGGMDVDPSGTKAVFHGITSTSPIQRAMFAADIQLVDAQIVIMRFY